MLKYKISQNPSSGGAELLHFGGRTAGHEAAAFRNFAKAPKKREK